MAEEATSSGAAKKWQGTYRSVRDEEATECTIDVNWIIMEDGNRLIPSMKSQWGPNKSCTESVCDGIDASNDASYLFRPGGRGDSGRSTDTSVRAGRVCQSEKIATCAYRGARGSRGTRPASDRDASVNRKVDVEFP